MAISNLKFLIITQAFCDDRSHHLLLFFLQLVQPPSNETNILMYRCTGLVPTRWNHRGYKEGQISCPNHWIVLGILTLLVDHKQGKGIL